MADSMLPAHSLKSMEDAELGNDAYQYDQLHKQMTRLFKLELNGVDELLSGILMSLHFTEDIRDTFKGSLDDHHEEVMRHYSGGTGYYALSYAWGSDMDSYPLHLSTISNNLGEDGKPIVMGQGVLHIRGNLYAFLQEMRRQQRSSFIWIDAICIDQTSDNEKNICLPLMRDIYEHAERVYVWLGDASSMERTALAHMPRITQTLRRAMGDGHDLDPALPDTFTTINLPVPSHEIWIALRCLMTRKWWSRLWALQEAVVANEVGEPRMPVLDVLCGKSSTPWLTFDAFALAITAAQIKDWIVTGDWGLTVHEPHGFDSIAEVRTCRESFNMHGFGISLRALLLATRKRQATVPADMVLGMLAMLDRHTIRKLDLNVSQPTTVVFIKFAKHYIRNEPKEILLNHLATKDRLPGLPSWCPNFVSPEETVPLGTRWFGHFEASSAHSAQMFHAGFEKHGRWKRPKSFWYYPMNFTNAFRFRHPHDDVFDTNNPRQIALVPDTDFIRLSGMHIDTVAAVVDCNPAAGSAKFLAFNSLLQTHAWEAECLALAKKYLPEGSEGFDIYARTLVGNRVTMDPGYDEPIVFDRDGELDFISRYMAFKKFMQVVVELGEIIPPEGNLDRAALRYAKVLERTTCRRRFFATEGGRIGLGPSDAEVGDEVVVVFYCPTPYLLRGGGMGGAGGREHEKGSNQEEGRSRIVGEAYVHGLMYSEALRMFEKGEVREAQWVIE